MAVTLLTPTSTIFGHKVYFDQEQEIFRWQDNGLPAHGNPRPCSQCNQLRTKEGYDPCLGYIPGVVASCCGHGIEDGWIKWEIVDDQQPR